MNQIIELLEKMVDKRIEMYHKAQSYDFRSYRSVKQDYDSLKDSLVEILDNKKATKKWLIKFPVKIYTGIIF